ncbi:MAG: spore maturation protein [Ruminococcaceae bacterium]|nr:spore maturation protein [Oscillospiraceae bacterium]
MEKISVFAIPAIMTAFAFTVIFSRNDMHTAFTSGVIRGFKTAFELTPVMIILMSSIYMLNISGFTDTLGGILTPVLGKIGIPSEIVPLILLRPVSGSGATAMVNDILIKYGADSFAGRCACVLAGCTDTILYTVSVYFGAVNIKNTRHALPAAFATQIFAVIISCLAVRIFFS